MPDAPDPDVFQPEVTVWFNPACSKCRTAQAILSERGVDATYVEYLRDTPTRSALRRVLALLGTDDPRAIARTGEEIWSEAFLLDTASPEQVLEAMAAHPILIERPIVIVGDRAIVARPPERVLELLDRPGSAPG